MTSPADWQRLKEWFGTAIETPPDRLDDLFVAVERESPTLAAELRSLIAEHHKSELNTIAIGAMRAPAPAEDSEIVPGTTIGPYRVLRELGRGGTGLVLLAERADDEFHRPVALKLLSRNRLDRRSRELLTMERRGLSQMQHPNIAALLDWGETADGAPWLATEYVSGQPIDVYCRTRALSVPAILGVFRQVCEAVQYAHRRLIVHRDLKPANILVTDAGLVKLLDFGIAKPLADATMTSEQDRRFTPAYASPEQITGEAVTPASDVYALGLLLYELLTGALPQAFASLEGMYRRLDEHAIGAPSTAADLPRARLRAIRGDLDRIVLHAVERQPENRYLSVEQLLADLDAFRNGFPIGVQRPSAIYRMRKFVRRHSVAVPVAAVAIVALVAATTVAISQARQSQRDQQIAEKRFRELQGFARSVIYELHDEIRGIPGTVAARRHLVTMALRYLDGLNAEHIADDSLQQELAGAYVRTAYIQGGYMGVNLGDTPGAMRGYRTAIGIYDDLLRRHPDSVEIHAARFGAAYHLSLMINDPAAAIRFATPFANQADAWITTNTTGQALFASDLMHAALGRMERARGALDASLRELDASADRQQRSMPLAAGETRAGPMFGTVVNVGQNLFQMAVTQFARAETLLEMGRAPEALAALTTARDALARSTGARASPSNQRMVARIHGLFAHTHLALGRLEEAQAASQAELNAATVNVADGSATAQRDLAEAYRHAGNIALAAGAVTAGIDYFREAARTIDAALAHDSSFLHLRLLQAVIYNDYARALAAARQYDRAGAALRSAIETADHALSEAPAWVEFVRERARALSALALRIPAASADRDAFRARALTDWDAVRRRSPLNQEYLDERTAAVTGVRR